MHYGRYEIQKELGRGSMGVVYLALDPNIERLVAVKVLRQDRMGNDSFVRRFIKEAKVIGRLSHANIVTVHDIGEEQGEVYIAMEYIEGHNLSEIISLNQLEASVAVDYGIQIAETLEYAHQKGVIHRDIKPSNIIVQPGGRIKITDFGIARIEDPDTSIQTQAGETMGTPSYMSPEQALGNTVDKRSDLFSLGVLLYELCTGKRPFGGEGKTLATIFNEIIQTTPPDPHIVSDHIPQELSLHIMKALRKDPANRFQTGQEMADALRESLKASLTEGARTEVSRDRVDTRNFRKVLPFAGAALLATMAAGTIFFGSHKEETPVSALRETRPLSPSELQPKVALKQDDVKRNVELKPAIPAVPSPMTTGKKDVPALPKPQPRMLSSQAAVQVKVEPKPVKPVSPPPPVPLNTKRTSKPETRQAKDTKPRRPDMKKERPEPRKTETVAVNTAVEKSALNQNPAPAEKPPSDKPLQQERGPSAQLPLKSTSLPKFAFLRIKTIPKGTTVYIDGIQKGTSPMTVKLRLGKYRIKLHHSGFHEMECLVNVDRMTEYPLTERLRPFD